MGNLTPVQQIQYDQHILDPLDVDLAPCPFTPGQVDEITTTITYHFLLQALHLGNRIESLVYAFYLGFLLDIIPKSQWPIYYRIISLHYFIAFLWIYYIFERYGVKQLYRSKYTTITLVHHLTVTDYCTLL